MTLFNQLHIAKRVNSTIIYVRSLFRLKCIQTQISHMHRLHYLSQICLPCVYALQYNWICITIMIIIINIARYSSVRQAGVNNSAVIRHRAFCTSVCCCAVSLFIDETQKKKRIRIFHSFLLFHWILFMCNYVESQTSKVYLYHK